MCSGQTSLLPRQADMPPRAVSSEPLPKRNSGGVWMPALHAASLSFSGNQRPHIHGYLYDPIHFLHQPRRHNTMKHVGSRSKHMTQHPTTWYHGNVRGWCDGGHQSVDMPRCSVYSRITRTGPTTRSKQAATPSASSRMSLDSGGCRWLSSDINMTDRQSSSPSTMGLTVPLHGSPLANGASRLVCSLVRSVAENKKKVLISS
jgi:hypothetical protein